MRRLTLLLIVFGFSLPLDAATYTTRNFTAAQETRLTRARLKWNSAECVRVGLPTSCTEAQAQAVDPQARVPVDTAAFLDVVLVRALIELSTQQDNEDEVTNREWWQSLTPAQKNAICTAMNPAPPVCRP